MHRQQLTEVEVQSDVAIFGLPYICPYNVNSIMNPILVMSLGLGYFFNLYRNQPIVRPGGVAIFYHPVRNEFHPVHHPSYIDFFEEVLPRPPTRLALETKFEEQFATDPWYIHLYRNSYAYHGVHPLYMWYWGAHAMEHLGDVIFVGGDRKTTARMGFRSASTLDDALEMASRHVGSSARRSTTCTPRRWRWQTCADGRPGLATRSGCSATAATGGGGPRTPRSARPRTSRRSSRASSRRAGRAPASPQTARQRAAARGCSRR